MFIPTAFAELNQGKLHDFIESHSFGLLVSTQGEEPFATHLPFLLEPDKGSHGTARHHYEQQQSHRIHRNRTFATIITPACKLLTN